MNEALRRTIQVLGVVGIALILTAMTYALAIGWLNYSRIGV